MVETSCELQVQRQKQPHHLAYPPQIRQKDLEDMVGHCWAAYQVRQKDLEVLDHVLLGRFGGIGPFNVGSFGIPYCTFVPGVGRVLE